MKKEIIKIHGGTNIGPFQLKSPESPCFHTLTVSHRSVIWPWAHMLSSRSFPSGWGSQQGYFELYSDLEDIYLEGQAIHPHPEHRQRCSLQLALLRWPCTQECRHLQEQEQRITVTCPAWSTQMERVCVGMTVSLALACRTEGRKLAPAGWNAACFSLARLGRHRADTGLSPPLWPSFFTATKCAPRTILLFACTWMPLCLLRAPFCYSQGIWALWLHLFSSGRTVNDRNTWSEKGNVPLVIPWHLPPWALWLQSFPI